jgi:hypothetical protein
MTPPPAAEASSSEQHYTVPGSSHTSRQKEAVKQPLDEQKHFTQRRKEKKAVVLSESLRLGVFA